MAESWPWYECVPPEQPLLQGDFIHNCPLLGWAGEKLPPQGPDEAAALEEAASIIWTDVIIMTQACDLENCKVNEVVVCRLFTLEDLKTAWAQEKVAQGQEPKDKAWGKYCSAIRDGHVWNFAMLNKGESGPLLTGTRVVDFHDIHTLPRAFLEGVAATRGHRLRLLPPYREHLSQAFARYFMRVGLPSSVDVVW